mgnify:CR=1 FL=1
MAKKRKSIGELISSFVFFGIAVWAFFEGKSFFQHEEYLKCIFVYLGGTLSFLAAFRYQIQHVINSIKVKK